MGTLATIKFGLGIAGVFFGVLVVAFLGYMSTFGKVSTLRQKKNVESNESN
jgi:hypothetical protein